MVCRPTMYENKCSLPYETFLEFNHLITERFETGEDTENTQWSWSDGHDVLSTNLLGRRARRKPAENGGDLPFRNDRCSRSKCTKSSWAKTNIVAPATICWQAVVNRARLLRSVKKFYECERGRKGHVEWDVYLSVTGTAPFITSAMWSSPNYGVFSLFRSTACKICRVTWIFWIFGYSISFSSAIQKWT